MKYYQEPHDNGSNKKVIFGTDGRSKRIEGTLREGFKNPSNGNLPLRGTEHIVFLPTHRFGPFFTDFFLTKKRGTPSQVPQPTLS